MSPDADAPISISSRFNGPLESGNGGYSAGLFATRVEGPAAVSLRSPVPLDTPLEVVREGETVRFLDGETLVAEASPANPPAAEVPAVISVAGARAASARYIAPSDGLFSRCFVCGRVRDDSLGVFAGRIGDGDIVATPWTPPPWAAGPDGSVAPELVAAVLDCPTYFALYDDPGRFGLEPPQESPPPGPDLSPWVSHGSGGFPHGTVPPGAFPARSLGWRAAPENPATQPPAPPPPVPEPFWHRFLAP